MQARFLLVLFLLVLPLNLIAQNSSRIEVFGGYSYVGYSVDQIYSGPWTRYNFSGWEASATVKVAPHIGVEGDFGGAYSSPYGRAYNLRTYMGGPRISADFGKVRVYGHLLFGGLYLDANYLTPNTSFAAVFGGGADYWLKRHFGVQLAQVDYLHNTNTAATGTGFAGGGPSGHLRISTGIVLRF
jgi:hypothetical protein